ncbi:putative secreted protein (Por secretion system target) [Kordia periserrulae]|uniref:Putative secreted protein (Por secretion system target) n=1 Tax=Kordia periserrulae TaxID=701523 RepID=A0A2T6BXX4_9FLAO|nr:T9SS type A sorting domain-containing protein [Kordia periserrulae]PTX60934.1 putative secreted protein (Por secretion system target) [Kordia periserrulae]
MKRILLFTLFFSISITCFAQKRTLTGTIYDEEKNVLADANVIVKNSKNGTITNKHGRFAIEVEPNDILEISYLGFETKEIPVSDAKEIKVNLLYSWEKMDTVEVVGYGGTIHCVKLCCCCFGCVGTEIEKETSSNFKRIQGEERLNSLFPNPSATGLFQLQLHENYTQLTTEVFNLNGQLLQSNTYTQLSKLPQIDLSKQPKGIYLIKITADGKVLETKKAMRL